MNYTFHLLAGRDPRVAGFAEACALFEDKFSVDPAGDSGHLILSLAGEQLALFSEPRLVPPSELRRVFGETVARQLRGPAWVSEVSCPMDKDTAEAARTFLMILVHQSHGVVVDPQAREILNALDA